MVFAELPDAGQCGSQCPLPQGLELQTRFHRTGAAGPEEVLAIGLLAGLGQVGRVQRQHQMFGCATLDKLGVKTGKVKPFGKLPSEVLFTFLTISCQL